MPSITSQPQSPGSSFSLAAIILAAGQSSRMGRPKLLLPWGNTSVLGHLIGQWTGLRAGQVAVVFAAGDLLMQAELDRLEFLAEHRITNPDPVRGMFSSVQCAARWCGWHSSLTRWAVALGDQPHLQPATLAALIEFARQQPKKICQPARRGHGRHPVILPAAAFKRIANSTAGTFQEFLQSSPEGPALVELPDPGLDLDIDVPADYEEALKLIPRKR